MTPYKGILDPAFRYLPSYATDIRKTFKRFRTESSPRQRMVPSTPTAQNVIPLKKLG